MTPRKFNNKRKQNTVATTQYHIGSDSCHETKIIAMRMKGKPSNASTSSSSKYIESQNDKEKIDIFHMRVITKHAKVDTLFDSGSQVNIISEAIVKKLNLETIIHTKPYPFGWVCDDAKLQVTRMCKLKFSITANFIDEVELDVVPLDICGIF